MDPETREQLINDDLIEFRSQHCVTTPILSPGELASFSLEPYEKVFMIKDEKSLINREILFISADENPKQIFCPAITIEVELKDDSDLVKNCLLYLKSEEFKYINLLKQCGVKDICAVTRQLPVILPIVSTCEHCGHAEKKALVYMTMGYFGYLRD